MNFLRWLFGSGRKKHAEIDYTAPYVEPWIEQALQDFENEMSRAKSKAKKLRLLK